MVLVTTAAVLVVVPTLFFLWAATASQFGIVALSASPLLPSSRLVGEPLHTDPERRGRA